jgi:aspartyl-tRNA(Asn)/glutamyl-tRNA(Gln) amidotransferase subunit B
VRDLHLSPDSAFVLTSDKPLADYFEEALATGANPRNLCNWLITEFAGRYKESGKTILNSGIRADQVGNLVKMVDNGTITGRIAKAVADDMVASPGKDPEKIISENPDYQPLHDTAEIEGHIDQVLAEHRQSVLDYRAGKDKAFSFLVGQVMKLTRGKASPAIVNEILKSKIEKIE